MGYEKEDKIPLVIGGLPCAEEANSIGQTIRKQFFHFFTAGGIA